MKKDRIKILFEDKNILVTYKPAGLLTISTNNEKEKTMFHKVFMYLKTKNSKVFIVHRLDRDTGGIIVFAKNEKVKQILQTNWDQLVVKRGYIAVVEGQVEKKEATIKSYLKETSTFITYSSNKANDGKLAITKYKTLKTNKKYSLLEIEILTGRKNQIRVHMKDIGHPIIGDKKYDAKSNPIKRLGLEAVTLNFYHPITKQLLEFSINPPKEFEKVIN